MRLIKTNINVTLPPRAEATPKTYRWCAESTLRSGRGELVRLYLDTKRVERVQIRHKFLLTYFTYVDLNVHVHVPKYTELSVKKC